MKVGRIKSTCMIITLFYYTVVICARSVFKYFFGKPTRPWVDKTIQNWVDQMLKKAQVTCEVINPHNTQPTPGRATLLMCNHSSAFDIPLSFKAFPNHSIRMLAKRELSKIPIMAQGMTAAEFAFIDRKNRYQAIKDLAHARELMESGIIMWIAPEGTRSKDGKLAPFKKGAFITAIQAQAIIIPIGIRGAFDVMPGNSLDININKKTEIHIGKAIDASQYSIENKDELVKVTHDAIKELVGE